MGVNEDKSWQKGRPLGKKKRGMWTQETEEEMEGKTREKI